jgi:hypothetical protein
MTPFYKHPAETPFQFDRHGARVDEAAAAATKTISSATKP